MKTDPIEKMMDKYVEDMDASDLVVYMKTYLEVYGIHLQVDGLIERKILESFLKRYPGNGGRIMKYVMLVLKGKKDGRYVTWTSFSKGMKWWTDQCLVDLQQAAQERRAKAASQTNVTDEDIISLADYRRRHGA